MTEDYTPFRFTDSQRKDFNRLTKIANFGARCLQNMGLNDVKNIQMRKSILFKMFIAIHSYTESIHSLCKKGHSHACFVILKPLCETLIKAKFLFISKNLENTYLYLLEGLKKALYKRKSFIKYYEENPHKVNKYYKTINLLIKDDEKYLKKQVKKLEIKCFNYEYKKIASIEKKALEVDKYNKDKNLKSESSEFIYILIYRKLCDYSHLNDEGLSDFFEYSQNTINVFLSGNPEDIDEILKLTIFLYKELLSMFLRVFKSPLRQEFRHSFRIY